MLTTAKLVASDRLGRDYRKYFGPQSDWDEGSWGG